jgi:hypothetical protein
VGHRGGAILIQKEVPISRLATIAGLMGVSVIAIAASRVLAADDANPNWPCIQRKVATLTSAQMWDGPTVDDLTEWRGDEEMKKLIAFLASRRVPLDEAAAAIARFAAARPDDKRDDALKQLFAGLVSTTNNDRAAILDGIERFQQRQKARAAEIERQGAALRRLREQAKETIKDTTATGEKPRTELAEAEERFNWDTRVFTERAQSLPLACEVPVLIEQRLFELAREIRANMIQ